MTNKSHNSDDKRQQFNFNPNSSIVSLVNKIEKEMGTKTFTNRHLNEHKQNTLLNNISNLSPELQKYVTDKYDNRFNKMKNFSSDERSFSFKGGVTSYLVENLNYRERNSNKYSVTTPHNPYRIGEIVSLGANKCKILKEYNTYKEAKAEADRLNGK